MDVSDTVLPTVVVVVVTSDPGPELERTLTSVVAQDVHCSLLVIDDSSTVDVSARVAAVAPGAFVKRLPLMVGFAAAANKVLTAVEGAKFYLVCHDDIDLAPTAVRAMLDEAQRSQAGIVTPKFLASDNHELLVGMGLATDRTARPVALVERRELDQHQHDQERDVAAGSGACLLIRAELFAALRGFDELTTAPPPPTLDADNRYSLLSHALSAPELGEDIDLCWRARLRGARIVVAPGARVAHAERAHRLPSSSVAAMTEDEGHSHIVALNTAIAARTLALRRNRVRTVVSVHGLRRLVPAVLSLVLQWVLLVRRSRGQLVRLTRHVPRQGIGALRKHRIAVQRSRSVTDAQLDRLHLGTLDRWRHSLSADLAEDGAQAWTLAERTVLAGLRRGPGRWIATAGTVFTVIFVVGSRHLIGQRIPVVGQLVPFASLDQLLRAYGSGWRLVVTGSSAPGPPAMAILALLRIVTLGADGLGRTLVTVGMIPVGVLGAWRLARRLTQPHESSDGISSSARRAGDQAAIRLRALAGIAGAVAYGACPLPYGALRLGRWDALLVYGAAPWLLGRLLSTSGWAPFSAANPALRRPSAAVIGVLRGAVPLALLSAFVPSTFIVLAVMVAGLAVGSVLIGERSGISGPLKQAVSALVGAFFLLFPWSLDMLRDRATLLGGGPVGGRHHAELLDLLRFHTAPGPAGWLAVALPVAAFIPLLLVGEDRLRWTARLWAVAIVSLSVAWAGERGWLGGFAPTTEVVLVPAALALALAAALGAAGIVADLRLQQFGWRQALVGVGAAALVVGALPTVWGARDGSWGMAHRDHQTALSWMDDQLVEGGFRILWLGSARMIPGGGWSLDGRQGTDQLAWSMSTDAQPDVRTSWPGSMNGGGRLVADDLRLARDNATFHLGQQFSPMAVRYVVLVERAAPDRSATSPLPDSARRMLDAQLDLRQLDVSGGLRVYENTTWVPRRTVSSSASLAGAAKTPSTVLGGASDGVRISGQIPRAGTLRVADTPSSRWSLHTSAGTAVRTNTATSMDFAVTAAGPVRLDYQPPPLLRLALFVQVGLWVLAGGAAIGAWRARRRHLAELVSLLPPEEVHDGIEGAFSVERAFADDDALEAMDALDRPTNSEVGRTDAGALGRSPSTPNVSTRLRPKLRLVHSGSGAMTPPAESVPGDDEAPVEGTLADELWASWTTRQGLKNRTASSSDAPIPSTGDSDDVDDIEWPTDPRRSGPSDSGGQS